jgi:hypothetical protein
MTSSDVMTGDDYFADIEPAAADEPMTLKRFMELAEQARKFENEIAELTATVKDKTDRLNKILCDFIPSAMQELGLQKFTLTDGSEIKLENVIHAYISEEHREPAFQWLTENNFEAIIKTRVHADFGKDEIEDAQKALVTLRDAGFAAAMDRNIHASTLKAFVVEQLGAGTNLPLELFGVHQFDRAKITRPRTRRARG